MSEFRSTRQRSRLGDHAIVVGAGIGGLCAAAALANHFERVTVLERDALPDSPDQRMGTPQGRHVHGLLYGGQLALEELFPDFRSEMARAGAVPARANIDLRMEMPGYDPMPARDFGWTGFFMSRPLIEFVTRKLLCRRKNVGLRPRIRVPGLLLADDGQSVLGVRCEPRDGPAEDLHGELVVDATGRAALTLGALPAGGLGAPQTSEIGVDFSYASAVFELPAADAPPWKAVLTFGQAPQSSTGGILAALEGDRWILSVGGRGRERPPGDRDAFMQFLRGLRTSTIYDTIKGGKQIGDIARFNFDASVWRHFDRLETWPRGLLPFADSICRFNPVYGQGMSVAAKEAVLLNTLLSSSGADNIESEFLKQVQPLLSAPWQMSAIPDFIFPDTRGERPANFEEILKYGAAFAELAYRDAAVHKLDAEVRSLQKAPSALLAPEIVARVQAIMAEQGVAAQ